jgi:FtsP/CotA-like multicopper oxidase with cupredoxin domain
MRPGTFIYHSHLDDVTQLTGGLYGVMVVLPAGEDYKPETDHSYVAGWKDEDGDEVELNGRTEQPVQHAVVGETHRLRVVHIAPAGNITARMVKGETPVPLRTVAKDGAELPTHQQVNVEVSRRMGVGETADFEFTPTEAGTYEFVIGYPRRQWRQRWVVAAVE